MDRTLPLAAAALLAALLACRSRGAEATPAPAPGAPSALGAPPAAAAPAPDAVRLVAPERVRYAPRLVATGTLKARNASPLAMSVPGTLAKVAVARGQEVKEGALLASLDDGAAAASRRQAEAAVAAAQAQLALAEDALARATRIAKEEGVSEAALFQARSQRELAAAQLAAAGAQLEQARVHLRHHHLRAPFDGVVTKVPDGLGITVAPGVPLVVLVSTRTLVLETSFTQDEAAELRPGTRATVAVPVTGAKTPDATVSVVVPAVDAGTNRVPVELAVPNAGGRFLPNAFARAELPRREERDAWRVPSGALVQREGGYGAWVAGADGRARVLPVQVLGEEGDAAIVAPAAGGAWPEGLRVLEAPPLGIAEGMAVAAAGAPR